MLFALRWQLSPTQVKCKYNANGSIYILYGVLIEIIKVRFGSCFMIMQTILFLFRGLKKCFEMFAKCMRCLPQRDHKTPSGI